MMNPMVMLILMMPVPLLPHLQIKFLLSTAKMLPSFSLNGTRIKAQNVNEILL
jgi:hypothetical protein